jgi:hypothetical protein
MTTINKPTWHAILLPLSAGFKQLQDRIIFDGSTALVFPAREDAERYIDRATDQSLQSVGATIEPIELSLTIPVARDPTIAARREVSYEGLTVGISRSRADDKLVVEIEGPENDTAPSPQIRIWLNEALIYRNGKVGDDLSGADVLYVRPKDPTKWDPSLDRGWEAIAPSDDPNTQNYEIHSLWEQGITELSINNDDGVISDHKYDRETT